MSRIFKTIAIISFAAIVIVAGFGLSIWQAYRAIPPITDQGLAYTFGVQLALNSEHVHAIWEGKEPEIVFRSRQFDNNNKYTWQKATLRRPGQCLDLTDSKGAPATLSKLCAVPDKLEIDDKDFAFEVDAEKAISIGVTNKPLSGNRIKPRGAMFGVEGHIGIGTRLETALDFHVELTASGVNLADVDAVPIDPQGEDEGDEEVGGCGKPSLATMRLPIVLSFMPAVPARLCRFRAKAGGRILSLIQYQRGLMRHSRVTTIVQCSALLNWMLRFDQPTDFGGCIGADWNKREAMEVDVVMFTISGVRRTGVFR